MAIRFLVFGFEVVARPGAARDYRNYTVFDAGVSLFFRPLLSFSRAPKVR